MIRGAITSHIDVAQIVLYAFWIFFAGLIFYLRREDRREGYPLESEDLGVGDRGFLLIPEPKTFLRSNGSVVFAPNFDARDNRPLSAAKVAPFPGAPLTPEGDPMRAEVGPGAYAMRADETEKTFEGHDLLAPLRIATNFALASEGPDPIGMKSRSPAAASFCCRSPLPKSTPRNGGSTCKPYSASNSPMFRQRVTPTR